MIMYDCDFFPPSFDLLNFDIFFSWVGGGWEEKVSERHRWVCHWFDDCFGHRIDERRKEEKT